MNDLINIHWLTVQSSTAFVEAAQASASTFVIAARVVLVGGVPSLPKNCQPRSSCLCIRLYRAPTLSPMFQQNWHGVAKDPQQRRPMCQFAHESGTVGAATRRPPGRDAVQDDTWATWPSACKLLGQTIRLIMKTHFHKHTGATAADQCYIYWLRHALTPALHWWRSKTGKICSWNNEHVIIDAVCILSSAPNGTSLVERFWSSSPQLACINAEVCGCAHEWSCCQP